VLAIVLMMLIPLFTMRLIAEERRNQTWILLTTSPISATDIVLGKFFGLLAMLSIIIAACALMVCSLALGTHADFGLIACNMLGVWLLAASYAALGIFFSSLTRQPIVAAFGALAVSFGLWMLELSSGAVRVLAPTVHFQNLNVGLISTADLIYFALFIVGFLLLTIERVRRERGEV